MANSDSFDAQNYYLYGGKSKLIHARTSKLMKLLITCFIYSLLDLLRDGSAFLFQNQKGPLSKVKYAKIFFEMIQVEINKSESVDCAYIFARKSRQTKWNGSTRKFRVS